MGEARGGRAPGGYINTSINSLSISAATAVSQSAVIRQPTPSVLTDRIVFNNSTLEGATRGSPSRVFWYTIIVDPHSTWTIGPPATRLPSF